VKKNKEIGISLGETLGLSVVINWGSHSENYEDNGAREFKRSVIGCFT